MSAVPDVLVISGPAGVGKSSVAFEVSHQLRTRGVEHALIDSDDLDRIYPVPPDLPKVTEPNLRAVWRTFAERGVKRLIVTGVYLHRPSELEWVARAVPEAAFTVVRLMASEAVLIDRVRRREIGSGVDAQIAGTRRQLAAMKHEPAMETVVTDGRSVRETALQIVGLWLPSS